MCHSCGVDQYKDRMKKPKCKDPLCYCVWRWMNCSGRPPPYDNWAWIPVVCCPRCIGKRGVLRQLY